MSNIKGYAVLRTAENAKEVNEWFNKVTGRKLTHSIWYLHFNLRKKHADFYFWNVCEGYELCPDFTTFKERVEAMEKPEEKKTGLDLELLRSKVTEALLNDYPHNATNVRTSHILHSLITKIAQ